VRRIRRRQRLTTGRAAAGRAPTVCFDERIEVRCTPAAAFDLLANVDRYATGPGSPVVAMTRSPPGPTVVGTRFREVLRLGPLGRFTVWSEVLTLDRPRCLEERFRGPGMRGHLRYTLTGGEAGRTVLRQQQTFVVTGPLALLQTWGIRRAWRPRASARLRAIRDLLEATARRPEPAGRGQAERASCLDGTGTARGVQDQATSLRGSRR
jgi:hypothetical protein